MSTLRKNDLDHDDEEEDSKIFPQRLMEILGEERNQDSISWLPHGRAFMIRNRKLFSETVMPNYFSRKAKYSSFTRKLNRWNFVRVSSGPELGAYYHEFFLRDKPHLAAQMFCKNARTLLAMAANGDSPKHPPENPPEQESLAARVPSPVPISPALLAALTKEPAPVTNPKGMYMTPYAATNIKLLEMHMLQQEQANRILLEHARALSIQQREEQQRKLAAEQADLMQMRQFMEMRIEQQQGRAPTNHRASAA